MEPTPLAPSPIEVVYAIAVVVALVFAAYAIRKMAKHEWPVGFALTLILFTFVVPFSGPVVVGLRTLWRRRVVESSSGRA
jgi:predicted Kef-type K+ transport protein